MAGLADYLNRVQQLPDSIDTRRVPVGAQTRAPAANMQPYQPAAQAAIESAAGPVRNNPAALNAMNISQKPGTIESAAKKVGFGLHPEIAAGQLESQLKYGINAAGAQANPANQIMQGGPNFTLRGPPTNVPNFTLEGLPKFQVPSTEVLSRSVVTLPPAAPVDVSSKPAWGNLRAEYVPPKYGANVGTQMGQGYVPPSAKVDPVAAGMSQSKAAPGFWDAATMGGGTVGEEASGLRKAAGVGAGIGAALTGGLGTWMRRTPAAIPVIEAGGVAQEMMDPSSRYSQALKGIRENVKEAYRTEGLPAAVARQIGGIIPAAYETLGAAGAPFEKMTRSALRNLAAGAGIAESPSAAMARARDIYNRDIAPTRGAQSTIDVTRGEAPIAESGRQITIRRGTNAPDVYGLDAQGNVTGLAQPTAGGAGLTPAERAYNTQLTRGMELENQRQAQINDELAYQMRGGEFGLRRPSPRLISALMGGKAAVSGTPAVPPTIKPMPAADVAMNRALTVEDQRAQISDQFDARMAQLQSANPQITDAQIAADPQIRALSKRRAALQARLDALQEITSKKLPGMDYYLGRELKERGE